MITLFLITYHSWFRVGLLPDQAGGSPLLNVASIPLMLFEPKQIFEQIIIAIDQSYIAGPRARAVAQNAWRRFVVRGDWCQISIDQRLHDPLAFSTISGGPGLIGRHFRQAKQSASHDGRGRSVSITKVHAFIDKVVPRHAIFGQTGQKISSDFFG